MRTTRASGKPGLAACLLTPPGEGGISVIALWGEGAAGFAEARLKPAGGRTAAGHTVGVRPGRLVYGFFCGESGEILDEVILGFAARDRVEINCHGGALPARRILEDLSSSGVSIEKGGAGGAFGHGARIIEREAFEALPAAQTSLAARVLAAQAGGALEHAADGIGAVLSHPPVDFQKASRALGALSATAALGIALTRPAAVAVAGPANAGKSTLVNALAGYGRNIVTDVPGTTRDAVRVPVALFGVPVVLIDTAGAAASRTPLAAEAALRASNAVAGAHAVLIVVDSSAALPDGYAPPGDRQRTLVAANKADLAPNAAGLAAVHEWGVGVVETSAVTGAGLEDLSEAMLGVLGVPLPGKDSAAGAVIFTDRQLECVRKALQAVERGDVKGVLEALKSLSSGP
ncbi:MAG: 50S ribosome-binding GTPase [Planctomycetes bacterium]|nr:50S ribosome-binding GTPase [Planctomycetota bacterium]